jgi:hypothetical protein
MQSEGTLPMRSCLESVKYVPSGGKNGSLNQSVPVMNAAQSPGRLGAFRKSSILFIQTLNRPTAMLRKYNHFSRLRAGHVVSFSCTGMLTTLRFTESYFLR